MYQAFIVGGTEISSELEYVEVHVDLTQRTPNRGYGIHCVPREKGVYVGASSVITKIH